MHGVENTLGVKGVLIKVKRAMKRGKEHKYEDTYQGPQGAILADAWHTHLIVRRPSLLYKIIYADVMHAPMRRTPKWDRGRNSNAIWKRIAQRIRFLHAEQNVTRYGPIDKEA